MKKADSSFVRQKLTLFQFPFSGILTNHEGIRRRVHRFSGTAAFLLFISWTRHPHSDECNVLDTLLASPKGYRTMLAIHDQTTQQICDRLKTTCMGLGLVRLLQDAKRFEEARVTLFLLEGVGSGKPSEKKTKRITRSRSSGATKIDAA
jgi:hypothetical protein